jgi:hypothetical protein
VTVRYTLQMEDHWQQRWGAIGACLDVLADSPEEAIGSLTHVGLRRGVVYRIRVIWDDGEGITGATMAPHLPAPSLHVSRETESRSDDG